MEWVEAEAKTRAEAEAKILEALNETDINRVEFEEMKVVRKFLGMGGRMVKLRGRLKKEAEKPASRATAAHAPASRVADEVEDEPEEYSDEEEDLDEEDEEEEEEEYVEAPKPAKKAAPAPAAPPTGVTTFSSKYRPWVSEGPSAIIIPPEGKGFGRKLYSAEPSPEDEPAELDDARDSAREREEKDFVAPTYADDESSPVSIEDRDSAVAFVTGLIEKMDMGGKATGWRLADRLLIVIDSENGALLIGRKGETLESIQYLVDILINRKREERVRVIVDAEFYRERRRYKVYQIAQEAADRAAQSGKPVRLNPMSPAERQIVHSTLADDKRVETISEGQGNHRKVVVYPKGKRQGKPKEFGGKGGGPKKGFGRGGGGGRDRDFDRDRDRDRDRDKDFRGGGGGRGGGRGRGGR